MVDSIWRKNAANRFYLADCRFFVGCNGLDRIFQIVILHIHSSSADSFVGVIDRSAIDKFSTGVDEKRLRYMGRLQPPRMCLRGRRPIIRLMPRTISRTTGVLDAKRLTRIFHNSAADRSVMPFGLSKRPIPIFDRSSSCRVLGCTTLPWISREPESLSRVDFVAAQSVVVSARSLHTAGRSKRWTIHDWPRYSQQPRRWLHRLDRRSRGV